LDLAITAALVIALPLARRWVGVRQGEAVESRSRAVRRAALGAVVWLAWTGAIASSGVLLHWDRTPPPMMLVLVGSIALTIALACTSFGGRLAAGLPLWALIGYQGFRVAVEFMLHRAYEQGVIGAQMTWSGRNFDVVSGASALLLGFWLWRRGETRTVPRGVVWAWNLLGLGLLVNIVVVAVLSMPTRLRAFDGPPNEWVATFPYVWLPTVMVTAALFGHVLVGRALLRTRR
jgi:hypothetical protein